ncbi:radical SAM family heme chaperone HemW [Vulgatibacter incomptus]|uniref:Heme chaperone HemW n=1 Tax=Vulgatibacter incomptus TaxID=1391653 RepID=A0A0K1PF28_9BACT|nr:radical SAM family heme chaperone HemW [Vulgatibacter incomptus]AKU92138.1 Radical SAM family enzyme [Vulgatibacter incomptus]
MVSFASRFGVYVHFPYCLSKCPYCDFASVVAESIPHERYAKAIAAELALRAAEHGRPEHGVESLYFGGGTPSLWEPRRVGETIEAVDRLFGLAPSCEITLEANPGASEAQRFSELRRSGVNRLSIGVQSFHPAILAGLGRRHSGEEAGDALEKARRAGFENVSLDLIFGGPHQTEAIAEADVRRAIELGPEHISCYGLTLEGLAEDVRLAKDVRRGKVQVADDALQERMGRLVRAALEDAGLRRYEISNFAKAGFESRHNSLYWMGREYVAAGCGAHGYRPVKDGGLRYGNPRKPEAWLEAVEAGRSPEVERDEITRPELFEERIFLGLRLVDGLDLDRAAAETIGAVPPSTRAAVARLVAQGLLEEEGAWIRCTERGMDYHTEVAVQLLPSGDSTVRGEPAASKPLLPII